MSYLEITDGEVAAYQPISERLLTQLRDNIRATAVCSFAQPLTDVNPYTFVWPGDDLVWKDIKTVKVFVPEHVAKRGCRLYFIWICDKLTGTPALTVRMKSPTDNGDEFLTLTDPYPALLPVNHDTTAAGVYSYTMQAKPALTGTDSDWRFSTRGDAAGIMVQQGETGGWAF